MADAAGTNEIEFGARQSGDSSSYSGSGGRRSVSSGRRGRGRSRSVSAEYGRAKRQNTLLRVALFALTVTLVAGMIFGSMYLREAKQRLAAARQALEQTRTSLEATESDVERMGEEMNALVEGRIPGLTPIDYDRVIPLDQDYVKNLVFTAITSNDSTRYEYRVVLHNRTPVIARPLVKLFLFDRTGLQIALSEIELGDDAVMKPDENLSHYDTFDITLEGREPAYFLVIAE